MQYLKQQQEPSIATQGGLQPSSRDLLHAEIFRDSVLIQWHI